MHIWQRCRHSDNLNVMISQTRYIFTLGQQQFQYVTTTWIGNQMNFVNDNASDHMQFILFQQPVDDGVGFFNGTHGNVSVVNAARRCVAAKVSIDVHTGRR